MSERTDPTIMGNDVPIGTGDPAVIRAEIHETRERMGETIEEIGERLNPNRLKEQVKENIRDATIGRVETMAHQAVDRVNDTRRTFTNTIRENPIPAAMIGIGLGWLLFNQRQQGTSGSRYSSGTSRTRAGVSSRAYSATEFSGPYAEPSAAFARGEGITEQGTGVADAVKERAGELADRAQNVAGSVAEQTRTQARRVEDQFYESPLAIGTATLALGLAAGLALPATRQEAELVGDTRDRLVDRVRNVARETADKVQNVAERVIDETQATGRQAAREEGLTR